MSNQENSPPEGVSSGATGPVEDAFNLFLRSFTDGNLTPATLHNTKIIWYLASMATYNTMVECIRRIPKEPIISVIVTTAYKKDLDQYFEDQPQPIVPGFLQH